MTDQEKLEANKLKFIDGLKGRFDKNNTCACEYQNCDKRLNPNQIQVFTLPDLEIKIFCFEHLLANLFRFDRNSFERVVDENYNFPLRGATKLCFEREYGRG